MRRNFLKTTASFCLFCLAPFGLPAQVPPDEAEGLPLKRISIFSSGVSYFEHGGTVTPQAAIALVFNGGAVNDALKSLVINDPDAGIPVVTYRSEAPLSRTLQSLKIDLAGNPGIAKILAALRGEEIQVTTSASVITPVTVDGRIVAVDVPRRTGAGEAESYVTLLTANGIRIIKLKDIQTFAFKDAALNADLSRALDVIRSSNSSGIKTLNVALSGSRRRDVSLSYVIPSPVWKVSYRLDLSAARPFLQGWAIIDNDSEADWTGVEISLVTGRPVSFSQNLYPPYYVNRPVLPLAIAGAAEAQVYESGYAAEADMSMSSLEAPQAFKMAADAAGGESYPQNTMARAARASVGGVPAAASGADAGVGFEFTLKRPVTLARQQSAMLPLVEGPVAAEKTLVFSGQKALGGGTAHPAISAVLVNNTGMKLPAGPITVFDDGAYAGDALIEFLPEGEKRIISYGDDLSVSGSVTAAFKRAVASVTVSGGIMKLSRKNISEKTYTIRNSGPSEKKLIIEHPKTRGAALTEPAAFDEQTDSLYRFTRNIAAGAVLNFNVSEETTVSEANTLSQINDSAFAAFATNSEIPAAVRAAFSKALSLKQAATDAAKALGEAEARRDRLAADEERIRLNIEAAGKDSEQGQEYLRRLAAQDAAIEAQNGVIDAARSAVDEAEAAYGDYLNSLEM
jgi:hypothetical protein